MKCPPLRFITTVVQCLLAVQHVCVEHGRVVVLLFSPWCAYVICKVFPMLKSMISIMARYSLMDYICLSFWRHCIFVLVLGMALRIYLWIKTRSEWEQWEKWFPMHRQYVAVLERHVAWGYPLMVSWGLEGYILDLSHWNFPLLVLWELDHWKSISSRTCQLFANMSFKLSPQRLPLWAEMSVKNDYALVFSSNPIKCACGVAWCAPFLSFFRVELHPCFESKHAWKRGASFTVHTGPRSRS